VQVLKKENEMSATPIEVAGQWLQNLLDPDVVNSLVAPDATYISLNTEDTELSKIMPWAGTSHGPQAFLDNLGTMFTRWENQAFNVTTMFTPSENVAVPGDFHGKVTYLQFLEDRYATAAIFRKDGSWTIQAETGAEPFQDRS
jgi:hypothetical protein